jgi:hypothetical protein
MTSDSLPDDVATLKAMVLAAQAEAKHRALLIEKLKYTIVKLATSGSGNPPSAVRSSISSSFNWLTSRRMPPRRKRRRRRRKSGRRSP